MNIIMNLGEIWGILYNFFFYIYTEYRLNRMGLSQVQGCCHFCKHHLETQQHLFYNCKIIFSVIHNIQTLIFEEDDITFVEKSMILGYDNGTEKSAIL